MHNLISKFSCKLRCEFWRMLLLLLCYKCTFCKTFNIVLCDASPWVLLVMLHLKHTFPLCNLFVCNRWGIFNIDNISNHQHGYTSIFVLNLENKPFFVFEQREKLGYYIMLICVGFRWDVCLSQLWCSLSVIINWF